MRLSLFSWKKPDIDRMREQKDISGLIRALRSPDFDTQWRAADALGKVGTEGFERLLRTLKDSNRDVRIGVIEALGEIKDVRAVPALIPLLTDESTEVRWATAVALGEIGDGSAIPHLVSALKDIHEYVRYGAAIALEKMGWQPADDTERGYMYLGKQEWEQLVSLKENAIKPLVRALRDENVDVRMKVVELLGRIGSPNSLNALIRSLSDENSDVRWKAVLAAPKCGISLLHLPRGVNKRPRKRKNPFAAAFFGSVSSRTPSVYFAWAVASSISCPSRNARATLP
jgi:HEAT repeat protein